MNSLQPRDLLGARLGPLLLLAAAFAAPVDALADDWPQRRGPRQDGSSSESSGWSAQGWARPLWQREVGAGASSPIVVGGVVYVLGWQGGRDRVEALDAASGEGLWHAEYAAPEYGRNSVGDKGLYSGPSSSPVFDSQTGLLFTLGSDGQLNAWDSSEAGRRVWGTKLHETFEILPRPKVGRSGLRDYGYTSSPLVVGAAVVVEVGAAEGNLVAFDKRSGRRLWASENRDPAGHTGGPVTLEVDGIPCVVVLTHRGVLVARLDEGKQGKTLATYPWETSYANNTVTPTVHEGTLLLTSAYNHQSIVRLAVTREGMRVLWERPFASKVASPVILDGHACWSWQKLRCLALADGEPRWEGGSFGDAGSLVATADGRLIVWGGQGRLALVDGPRRSPREYRERARLDDLAPAESWPHLALSDGRLLLRDRLGRLAAFALGARDQRTGASDPD